MANLGDPDPEPKPKSERERERGEALARVYLTRSVAANGERPQRSNNNDFGTAERDDATRAGRETKGSAQRLRLTRALLACTNTWKRPVASVCGPRVPSSRGRPAYPGNAGEL